MERRDFLRASAIGAAALGLAPGSRGQASEAKAPPKLKGRIKHSVSRWCYGGMALDDLCREVAAMGAHSVELLDEADWSVPAKHGLVCAIANGPGPIDIGWNRTERHRVLLERSEAILPKLAAAKIPNMIVFSGNRAGQPDNQGMKACYHGFKELGAMAEKHGVNILVELLNSKVDHADYQFDHMAWGVELVRMVESPRIKILYDIYHAQIMDGDVIRTIRDNIEWIGHFHTGGVPGRHEIDASQELNYTAICKAIADTGFQGYVGQEFVPTRDPMTSLREAIAICDV
ncbi:MAG: hydroxypyruvate isomerase family protein [Planctomycetota bacterium]